jgi:hypothetical protein
MLCLDHDSAVLAWDSDVSQQAQELLIRFSISRPRLSPDE